MDIFWVVLAFWVGLLLGYIIRSYFMARINGYSGTIVVRRDDLTEKTVYSLILDDYPEKLEFKKMVIFKVDTSEEKPGRK